MLAWLTFGMVACLFAPLALDKAGLVLSFAKGLVLKLTGKQL